jgi:nitroimidazol reductase NimA-like FMN-containing flavoprotein (pyridoxamine 5'-phosphate oxidase superfamily)
MLRTQRAGIPVCITVSHVDGLVLARCAFRHSLNYRAVMAFGIAAMIEDERKKEAGFNAFIERLYPGRTGLMRGIAPQELKATTLMSMVIEQASAKVRDDGPLDLEADYEANCWAGVVQVAQRVGAAVPDARVAPRRGARRWPFPRGRGVR